jgi:sulfate adenylyltransferase
MLIYSWERARIISGTLLLHGTLIKRVQTSGIKSELLIAPCGGELKELFVPPDEAAEIKRYAESLPSISLSERGVCDLEMLATGAFSPLDRFMGREDYERVLNEMRIANGHVFPIPITLPIDRAIVVKENCEIALRDSKQDLLAILNVEEIYEWDRREYARKVLGTESTHDPLVAEIHGWVDRFVSGAVRVFDLPRHYDFPELRLTPREVRSRLQRLGNPNVVAFQTRNPLHRAHEEMTKRAMDRTGGTLLMHPVVGLTHPGDIDHYNRVRTYKVLTEKYYDPNRTLLSLLPLAMRLAGPREALWHALIRRNYGANYFIVGRDHASPGRDVDGNPFYASRDALELTQRFARELEVGIISFDEMVYLPSNETYKELCDVEEGEKIVGLSGTSVRGDYLNKGCRLPEWYMRPEVAQILEESYPPKHRQGFCVWLTGLSGAGKSTTAEILAVLLSSRGRQVTLLDGDVVRTHLSAGLGFDRAGRDANIRRIGFVASEIARHGGVSVCAAISPYRQTRDEVRQMFGDNFIEVFIATPLEVCEERDPKGLYAKARRGELDNFTGVDDTYEPPTAADIVLDTVHNTAEENARSIIEFLAKRRYVAD